MGKGGQRGGGEGEERSGEEKRRGGEEEGNRGGAGRRGGGKQRRRGTEEERERGKEGEGEKKGRERRRRRRGKRKEKEAMKGEREGKEYKTLVSVKGMCYTELRRPFIRTATTTGIDTNLFEELCKFLDSLFLVRVLAGQGHVLDTVLKELSHL